MRVFVLVDYDNVKPERRDDTDDDVFFNANSISDTVLGCAGRIFSGCTEIAIRLYGGWLDTRGAFTPRAQALLRSVARLRGLRAGTRVNADIALSLLSRPQVRLIGTLRVREQRPEQKMVDSMICVDAMHLVANGELSIVYSDDDDVVPGVIGSQASLGAIALLRKRRVGTAINDNAVRNCGATVHSLT
jgi:hypothetical protein